MPSGDGITRRKRKDGSIAYLVRLGPDRLAQTFDTLKQARDAKAEDQLGRRLKRRGQETCDSFARRWAEDYGSHKRGSTNSVNEYALRPFIAEFRGTKLADVDRSQARAFALEHRRSAVVARALFNDAMSDELVERNPFAGLRLEQSRGRKDNTVLLEEEVHDLADKALSAHRGEYGQHFRAMVLFSFYTGLRLGEALALEWRDLNLGEGSLVVSRSLSKTGEVGPPKNPNTADWKILLLPEARDALSQMPRRNTERVFLSKRWQPFNTATAHYSIWNPVRAAAGRADFAWHELRHSCGHHFYIVMGYPDHEAAHQLRQDDGGELIRKLYGHPGQGAFERMRARLGQQVTPLRREAAR